MFSVFRPIAPLCLVVLLTGCAVHEPRWRTYRMVQYGAGRILVPPGVAGPGVAQRTFTADVVARGGICASAAGVALAHRKNRMRVTVTGNALVRQPPGWLGAWTAELEAQGCIATGDGLKLADWVAESLPLAPGAAFQLLHSSPSQTGQVDLGPQTRLQLVSPILRDGASPHAPLLETVETPGSANSLNVTVRDTGNAIGYETAWYAVRPKASGPGFTIAPLHAERNIQGKTEHRPRPTVNSLSFPADAAFYRLFYKADQTDFTALVVAARTRADLEIRTTELGGAGASCQKLNGELCVAIPRNVGVNPLLAVTVNGSEVMVALGASVRDTIQELGAALPRLAVSRLYHGRPAPVRFDRASPAILDLILTGGETISWK